MTQIEIESGIVDRLRQETEEVELLANGEVLGYFRPYGKATPEALEALRKYYTEERLERLRAQAGETSTAELIERLKQL